MRVYLGVLLSECPQAMLFYVKCIPVLETVMFILACFQSIL